jgi:hypothetical protein
MIFTQPILKIQSVPTVQQAELRSIQFYDFFFINSILQLLVCYYILKIKFVKLFYKNILDTLNSLQIILCTFFLYVGVSF